MKEKGKYKALEKIELTLFSLVLALRGTRLVGGGTVGHLLGHLTLGLLGVSLLLLGIGLLGGVAGLLGGVAGLLGGVAGLLGRVSSLLLRVCLLGGVAGLLSRVSCLSLGLLGVGLLGRVGLRSGVRLLGGSGVAGLLGGVAGLLSGIAGLLGRVAGVLLRRVSGLLGRVARVGSGGTGFRCFGATMGLPDTLEVDGASVLSLVLESVPLVDAVADTHGGEFNLDGADLFVFGHILVIDSHIHIITDVFDIDFHGLVPLRVLASVLLSLGSLLLLTNFGDGEGVHLAESFSVSRQTRLHESQAKVSRSCCGHNERYYLLITYSTKLQ